MAGRPDVAGFAERREQVAGAVEGLAVAAGQDPQAAGQRLRPAAKHGRVEQRHWRRAAGPGGASPAVSAGLIVDIWMSTPGGVLSSPSSPPSTSRTATASATMVIAN